MGGKKQLDITWVVKSPHSRVSFLTSSGDNGSALCLTASRNYTFSSDSSLHYIWGILMNVPIICVSSHQPHAPLKPLMVTYCYLLPVFPAQLIVLSVLPQASRDPGPSLNSSKHSHIQALKLFLDFRAKGNCNVEKKNLDAADMY